MQALRRLGDILAGALAAGGPMRSGFGQVRMHGLWLAGCRCAHHQHPVLAELRPGIAFADCHRQGGAQINKNKLNNLV